jgi:Cu/Ag efflux protein CusF
VPTLQKFARHIVIAAALACVLPAAALAQGAAGGVATAKADGVRMAAGEVEIHARVIELDRARRTATLQGPKGRIVTVDVPVEVKNFDQVRVGDDLVVRYAAAVLARLEPQGGSGIRERVESTAAASAPAGGLPGTGAVRTVEVLAVIQALDRKAGTATLRGAQRTVTMAVPPGADIGKLKVGDSVRAVFVEAAVLSVERAPAGK